MKKTLKTYKTYKIYPLHYILFYSCLAVCHRGTITNFLIQKFLEADPEQIVTHSRAELFEHMIEQIYDIPIADLYELRSHARIKELIHFLTSQNVQWDGVRVPIQTYANPKTYKMITDKSKNSQTLGEIIELAVEYYICFASNVHYNLIKLAFEKGYKEFYKKKSELHTT